MSRCLRAMPARMRAITAEAANDHGVALEDVLGPARRRKIAHARFDAMARIKRAVPHVSLPAIGGWFDRDHTTVLHALRRADELWGGYRVSQYAAKTEVPVEKSRAEIEQILRRYKADAFGYSTDGVKAVVAFRIAERHVRFLLTMPDPAAPEFNTYKQGSVTFRRAEGGKLL